MQSLEWDQVPRSPIRTTPLGKAFAKAAMMSAESPHNFSVIDNESPMDAQPRDGKHRSTKNPNYVGDGPPLAVDEDWPAPGESSGVEDPMHGKTIRRVVASRLDWVAIQICGLPRLMVLLLRLPPPRVRTR
eukprot:3739799-Pyramimonas_sp.AAC.1